MSSLYVKHYAQTITWHPLTPILPIPNICQILWRIRWNWSKLRNLPHLGNILNFGHGDWIGSGFFDASFSRKNKPEVHLLFCQRRRLVSLHLWREIMSCQRWRLVSLHFWRVIMSCQRLGDRENLLL